ncbi:MAG: MarR family transcriptional regulator [Deltaproteobacteria bacterium]|nr:MarR family transcriptional regulator [Deltaproteobacteria bacterium]
MSSDDKLIFLLTIVQQGVKNYANKALLAAGVRITLAQSGVLFLLEQQDRRMMSEIGRILGIENSAMTGLIDRLEKAGFVTRIADPEDRRALLICVTPAGLEEAEKAKLIIRGVNNEIKSGFSEHQVDVFSRVLDGLSKKFKGI